MARPKVSPTDVAGVIFAVALASVFLVVPKGVAAPAPVVPEIELVMASRTSLFATESTELYCAARHEEGLPLTYHWSTASGTLIPDNDSALWFAPEIAGVHTIVVEVRDDRGGAAVDVVNITVRQNELPVITEVIAEPAQMFPGQSAVLTCNAHDPEEHTLSYEWMAPSGELTGRGPSVGWTAPARQGLHRMAVMVTDELGATSTSLAEVEVVCPEPPTIAEFLVWPSLPDYTKEDIRGGYRLLRGSLTQCELECVASAPYGALTYEWSCKQGAIDGQGPIVLFTPPNDTAEVTVKVKVRDVCGQSAEAEMLFRVFQREEYSNEIEGVPGGCLRCLRGY